MFKLEKNQSSSPTKNIRAGSGCPASELDIRSDVNGKDTADIRRWITCGKKMDEKGLVKSIICVRNRASKKFCGIGWMEGNDE